MTNSAVIFGSIGTLVETSEVQRAAFNEAFEEAGLDWHWSKDEYAQMLTRSGGRKRIEAYAKHMGQDVDAAALHHRKTEIFNATIRDTGLALREGVIDVIRKVKQRGLLLGFATTTSIDNVNAIFDALHGTLTRSDFDFVGRADEVSHPKPDPAIYELALQKMEADAFDSIAIEDTAVSYAAARDAGLKTIAFPGAYAEKDAFPEDAEIVQELTVDLLPKVSHMVSAA